jgi:hypothetical protein
MKKKYTIWHDNMENAINWSKKTKIIFHEDYLPILKKYPFSQLGKVEVVRIVVVGSGEEHRYEYDSNPKKKKQNNINIKCHKKKLKGKN